MENFEYGRSEHAVKALEARVAALEEKLLEAEAAAKPQGKFKKAPPSGHDEGA